MMTWLQTVLQKCTINFCLFTQTFWEKLNKVSNSINKS